MLTHAFTKHLKLCENARWVEINMPMPFCTAQHYYFAREYDVTGYQLLYWNVIVQIYCYIHVMIFLKKVRDGVIICL